jgi:WD40 repeat protein
LGLRQSDWQWWRGTPLLGLVSTARRIVVGECGLQLRHRRERVFGQPARGSSVEHPATGDAHNNVRLWDPQTLQPSLPPLKGHTKSVFSVAFSPKGPLLASGSGDKTIRLWNPDTGASVGDALPGQSDSILSLAFSPHGDQLASGSYDASIWMWNGVDTADTAPPVGAELMDKNHTHAVHTAPVSAVAYSPSGEALISGSEDGTIRWWEASGYSIQLPSTRRGDWVQTVAFDPVPWCDPNSSRCTLGVLSCGTVSGIQVWNDVGSAIPLDGHNKTVTVVAFDPKNPAFIASGSADNHVMLWEQESSTPLKYDMPDGDGVGWLAFSPDGRRIVSASWDSKLYIWDAATGKPAVPGVIPTDATSVAGVAYGPDGTRIVSADNDHNAKTWTLQMWNPDTGERIGRPLTGHTAPLETVAYSRNGALIASGADDETIRLWDGRTGEPKGQLAGHTERVYSVAFSPTATASSPAAGTAPCASRMSTTTSRSTR